MVELGASDHLEQGAQEEAMVQIPQGLLLWPLRGRSDYSLALREGWSAQSGFGCQQVLEDCFLPWYPLSGEPEPPVLQVLLGPRAAREVSEILESVRGTMVEPGRFLPPVPDPWAVPRWPAAWSGPGLQVRSLKIESTPSSLGNPPGVKRASPLAWRCCSEAVCRIQRQPERCPY
jgi:hypothetical protein